MSYCIVDGNSIAYASQGTKALSVDGMEVQAIFQTLKTLRALRAEFKNFPNFLWLWDGKAQFRYDLYPEYKGNRKDTPEKRENKEKLALQKPYLEEMLTCLGVTQVVAPKYEADDLAGYFTRIAESKGKKSQLITGDGDWKQLISPLTSWHDPRNNPGKYCDHKSFSDDEGVSSVGKFIQLKALQGDSSDNISGVGGIGEKAATLILNYYGDVRTLVEAYKEYGEFTKENLPSELSRYRNKLNTFCGSNLKLFTRNYRLMNLRGTNQDVGMKSNMIITKGKKDMERFEELAKQFRFMSILRDLGSWGNLF